MKTTKKLAPLFTFVSRCSECNEIVEESCPDHPSAIVNSCPDPVECTSCSARATGHDADGDPACDAHRARIHAAGCGVLPFDGGSDRFVCLFRAEARERLGLEPGEGIDSHKDVLMVSDLSEVETLTEEDAFKRIFEGEELFVFDSGSLGEDPENPGAYGAWPVWLQD